MGPVPLAVLPAMRRFFLPEAGKSSGWRGASRAEPQGNAWLALGGGLRHPQAFYKDARRDRPNPPARVKNQPQRAFAPVLKLAFPDVGPRGVPAQPVPVPRRSLPSLHPRSPFCSLPPLQARSLLQSPDPGVTEVFTGVLLHPPLLGPSPQPPAAPHVGPWPASQARARAVRRPKTALRIWLALSMWKLKNSIQWVMKQPGEAPRRFGAKIKFM